MVLHNNNHIDENGKSTEERIGELYGYINSLKEDYVKYGKLIFAEKSAEIVSILSIAVVMLLFGVLFIASITVGIVVIFYNSVENPSIIIIGASLFFLLLGSITYFFRHKIIKKPIENLFIKLISD